MRYILIVFLFSLVADGCYYDHADLVYPQTSCNISNVTYSSSVAGILKASCYSCHSGTAASGAGIAFDSYTTLKTYVSNGQLINSISHTGAIPAMPLNGSPLSSCQIQTIQTWINNGALNN